MTVSVGIRELRENLSATINRVRNGETIEVTSHGQLVALLSPPPTRALSRVEQLIAEGRATAPSGPFTAPRRLPELVNRSGIPSEQIIADDREDRW